MGHGKQLANVLYGYSEDNGYSIYFHYAILQYEKVLHTSYQWYRQHTNQSLNSSNTLYNLIPQVSYMAYLMMISDRIMAEII